jgi:hypothetical protein
MTQEALPALSNQNDEEAARDEKGPEIFILSLAQDTRLCISLPVAFVCYLARKSLVKTFAVSTGDSRILLSLKNVENDDHTVASCKPHLVPASA